jgi:hypothetical protein
MVTIQNERGEVLEVTKGAFEDTYAAMGYSIVSENGGQAGQASNAQTAGFTGNPEIGSQDLTKPEDVSQEAKAKRSKSE